MEKVSRIKIVQNPKIWQFPTFQKRLHFFDLFVDGCGNVLAEPGRDSLDQSQSLRGSSRQKSIRGSIAKGDH